MSKPRSRRVVKQSNQEDDFLGQFGSGESLKSAKAREKLESMESNDAAKESDVHDDPVFNSGADQERILLEYVQPQADNPRFLPVKNLPKGQDSVDDSLSGFVVCEKGILENRLPKSDPRYKDIEEEIAEIKLLSNSIKEVGLIHPITVWRANTTNYPILTGHRRYYALRYLYGTNVKFKFKLHYEKPVKVNLQRHVENFLRKGLKPADALDSFMKAFSDIQDEVSHLEGNERNALICQKLSCSEATRFRFEKLAAYHEQVTKLFLTGIFTSQLKMVNFIVSCESEAGGDIALVKAHLEKIQKSGKVVPLTKPKQSGNVGRSKKYLSFPQLKVEQTKTFQRLFTENVTEFDIGVDWKSVNYEDPKQIEDVLKKLFDYLSE